MIYIIIIIITIINIFNIGLIANNNLNQNKKEKMLLGTYSLAELIYILFLLTLIEYTAENIVFILSFIIIWLLSKAYILTVNMNFENIEEVSEMENNNFKEELIEDSLLLNDKIEDIEVVSEVEPYKLESLNDVEEVKTEEIKSDELVEEEVDKSEENVLTPNSLYNLSDIITAKNTNEEEKKMRRRSLALKISKVNNSENNM